MCVSYVARSGVSNLGGSLTIGIRLTISVSCGTDHLRVVNIAPSAVATVASALSPGSLLFPFSDSSFASSSRPLSLPPPPLLSSSVSLASSSSSSSLASSSFSSSLPLPPSPAFPSPLAPSASFSSGSSLSASAAVRPPLGSPPLPPLPGFAPLAPSVSPPLPSSSLLSASSAPSFSSYLPPVCVSFSAGQAAPVLSSSPFSSSPLDFASYQASMLGLSQDYQSLARWYFLSGGSDFRADLSAFYPHLSSDASRDFSSGSSVFFPALRSVASSVLLPPVSSTAPPLPLVAPTVSSSRPLAPPFSAPYSVPVPSSLPSRAAPQGVGLYALGAASVLAPAPPGFPPLSAPSALLSVPPPAVSSSVSLSLPPSVSVFSPPASSLLSSAPVALPVLSAPALDSSPVVSEIPRLPTGPPPSLLHPFPVSDPPVWSAASALPPFSSAPLGSAAGPSGFASASSGSAFGHAGSASQPFLRCLVPLRLPPLHLSPSLITVLMILLLLGLVILTLPVLRLRILRLRFLHLCLTPLALRYGVFTSIWSISSRSLRVLRRLLFLLVLFSRSSLLLHRLLISLPF